MLLRKRKALLPAREILDEAIVQHLGTADIYFNRGLISVALGKTQQAIDDYTKAIEMAPKGSNVYFKRGQLFQLLGRDTEANEDYDEAIQLNPVHAMAQNNKAWILATSGDVDVRNGAEALASAKRAYDLTKQSGRYDLLDTLAAAYAENGQFKKAIDWQLKALEKAPETAKEPLTERLKIYRSNKPYRVPSSP